ncbi:EAL domain-containing protein [Alteromonas halophila]|uniref:EAL domain-containing protein n=1 Tax=Alteromonas halophila TaxID=516698 RepID=A0A918N0G4_9ALTE|nr:EAL domain-containing protein [Alteromonas halophila]GGW89775.1 hypothetical protein GCM10007391_25110 [Alteromonas halophila]
MNIFRSLTVLIFVLCGHLATAAPQLANPIFQSVSTQNGLPQDIVNDIAIDGDGFVWIATDGGLARWDGYRVMEVAGPDDLFLNSSIISLHVVEGDSLWISTYANGIFRYDFETAKSQQVISTPYFDDKNWIQYANSLQLGDDGWMYVALYQQIVKIHSDSLEQQVLFSLPKEMIGKATGIRYAIQTGDYVLVATTHGLLAVDQTSPGFPSQKVDHLVDIDADIDNVNVKFLLEDVQERIWIGTVNGLFMSPKAALLDYLKNGGDSPIKRIVAQRNVWEMEQVSPDGFWLGTNKGLVQLEQGTDGEWQDVHILEPNNGRTTLSNKTIYALEADALGNLWLSSVYGGALYFGVKSALIEMVQRSRTDRASSLSNEVVYSTHQSDPETLWVGTENGLNRYNLSEKTTTSYITTDDKRISENEAVIEYILPGPAETLYLQTYAGIRQFDMQTGKLRVPPVNEGTNADVFTAWNAGSALDDKGRLYFISDAFYRYDPRDASVTPLPLSEKVFDPAFSSAFLGVSPYHDNQMFLAMLGGLWLFDTETMEHTLVYRFSETQRRSQASISAWVVDKQGTLWLSFPGYGVVGLNADSFEPLYHLHDQNLLSTNILYSLQLDRDGDLWFSSHKGLHSYSPSQKTMRNYSYGRELSVTEFNEASEEALSDGRLAYGSTQGLIIFEPEALKRENDANSLVTREMAITDISLDSRTLSLPKRSLSGEHIALQHDDYGLSIYFTPLLTGANKSLSFEYTLYRNGQVVTKGVTTNPRITFGTLQPGDYRFVVAPAGQGLPFSMLPAEITLKMPYAPLRSPLAYTVYATIFLIVLAIYFYSRQQYINRLKRAKEQVTLFYDAFQHTRDWVIIFDKNKRPVAANPAFERIFGVNKTESLVRQIRRLYARYPKLVNMLSGRLSEIRAGEFWKDEGVVEGRDGREYNVLIDITAIGDSDRIDHYLLVVSDISEQKSAEQKLRKVANYDSLTGLVNRSLLLDRLEHAIVSARSHRSRVAVLFVDLDRFKGINDTLGHDFGDRLLRVVANRMQNLTPDTGTVARLGGDEFVIVIEDAGASDELGRFAASLVEAVETPIALGNETLRVSCSIGIAYYPDNGSEPGELIKHADVAMYAAKSDVQNSFTYFTDDMNARARHRLMLENKVKQAFAENAFFNHYQPIVNTQTGRTEGVELLLRCEFNGEAIYPDSFIPILEELKHIVAVTRDAFLRAINDMCTWYADGYTGYVSINLSPLHFNTEFDIDALIALLKEYNLPKRAIRFEITEGVLMGDTDNAYRQIRRFVDAGFVLALDDFGTGYSSLSYLKRYPLSVLKIDKSFVQDVAPGNANDALVETTINLAKNLNMDSVAEGVEYSEHVDYLKSRGCYLHQGYHYSRPVPAAQVPALLKKHW